MFQSLRNGRYTVTISPERQPRSLDQNALMWLWFTCIEHETGVSRQDVHDYYCKRFLRKTIHWNDHDEVIVEGTSKQSKDRMTDFLNQVQSDALTEFGIRLPLPEDLYFQDFYDTYK
ncbi:MAG: hypothetical protein IJ588_06280 [Prevotella sp.]|nr:hypothetical protein [Prevotella sp.]